MIPFYAIFIIAVSIKLFPPESPKGTCDHGDSFQTEPGSYSHPSNLVPASIWRNDSTTFVPQVAVNEDAVGLGST